MHNAYNPDWAAHITHRTEPRLHPARPRAAALAALVRDAQSRLTWPLLPRFFHVGEPEQIVEDQREHRTTTPIPQIHGSACTSAGCRAANPLQFVTLHRSISSFEVATAYLARRNELESFAANENSGSPLVPLSWRLDASRKKARHVAGLLCVLDGDFCLL